jgi:endonuclease YncB( thermonuclease family)
MILAAIATRIVAAGVTFTCTPTAVWDGDGPIWCAEGPKIRLAGIAAREIDGSCKPGHPCPLASAEAARDRLVSLLGGRKGRLGTGHVRVSAAPLQCRSEGGAAGSRTAAWCVTSSGVDLSCAMVGSGAAVRWDRYWKGRRC